MKKLILFGIPILLLTGCGSSDQRETTKSTSSENSSSIIQERLDSQSTEVNSEEEKHFTNSLSDEAIMKRAFIVLIKNTEADTEDLNESSYFYDMNIVHEENGNYSGGASVISVNIQDAMPRASFTLDSKGNIYFTDITGAPTAIDEDITGNIFDDVSQAEEDTIRNTIDHFSYRLITSNEGAFQNFCNEIFAKYSYQSVGDQVESIRDAGGIDILPEYARDNPAFRIAATTNSPMILAATADEIFSGSVSLSIPEDGSNPNAGWQVEKILTAEMWSYFDFEKSSLSSQEILNFIIENTGYEKDASRWTINDNSSGYDYVFCVDGTTQRVSVRGSAIYTSEVINNSGRMDVINYDLTKKFKEMNQ